MGRLQRDKVVSLLGMQGPFALSTSHFESRPEQQEMAGAVVEALNDKKIALIEAGTGTGKTLAYLVPTILRISCFDERAVISTHTISLQEQLLLKDIPHVLKTLDIPLKTVLVKGMGNYLCLRKLEEMRYELRLVSPQERQELEVLETWAHKSTEGSRSGLPIVPSPHVWERVAAEHDTCTGVECPHFSQCFFFKARREAQEGQLLIVNHHLLCADLSSRMENDNYDEAEILPAYQHVILDEAHHLEDVATAHFSARVSRLAILRTAGRLLTERGNGAASGKLPALRERLQKKGGNTSLLNRLNLDLPALRHTMLQNMVEAFGAYEQFIPAGEDPKFRISSHVTSQQAWPFSVIPKTHQFHLDTEKFVYSLKQLEEELKQIDDLSFQEETKGIRLEIQAMGARLEEASQTLTEIVSPIVPDEAVRWIEMQKHRQSTNTVLHDASLDVGETLRQALFTRFQGIVLCSATLSTNNSFSFVRQRLGLLDEKLPEKTIAEFRFPSPFDYFTQGHLLLPNDLPPPDHPYFTQAIVPLIAEALIASQGGAFVLFTSYTQMQQVYDKVSTRLPDFTLMKQGDENRTDLLNRFRSSSKAVLFGTDSFWEGIDVAGQALRLVIIAKLPFRVPSEPIIQARSEAIEKKGGHSFVDYLLPQAIVKLKQGTGRLIRSKRDRGCILCLDSRLITKGYGSKFLKSLPSYRQVIGNTLEIVSHAQQFFGTPASYS